MATFYIGKEKVLGSDKKFAIVFGCYGSPLIFAPQLAGMDLQQEYREELEKVQDRDFTHNWVSSSAFIFYLSVFCLLAFMLGTCGRLYTQKYERLKVTVQESTKYTPTYK